jgi:UDP-glucose 4-epimerase
MVLISNELTTEAYANTDKANTVLGWKAALSLDESLASAWKWEQKVRKKS